MTQIEMEFYRTMISSMRQITESLQQLNKNIETLAQLNSVSIQVQTDTFVSLKEELKVLQDTIKNVR